MSEPFSEKLDALQRDFENQEGRPFAHFFCPILQRDEEAKLCRGHVINQAFRDSARAWTVQRADVDGFFGSMFEAEFVLLQEQGVHHVADVLTDPSLSKKLRPEIRLGGRRVPHYRPTEVVARTHTEFLLEKEGGSTVRFALKLAPSEMLAALSDSWEVAFERDLRLPALVSLLKAAHLTMFVLMGYAWGRSLSGRFVGYDILGKFFDDNRNQSRTEALACAEPHFRQFVNLVRPIISTVGFQGTVTDRLLFLCTGGSGPWAFLVLIRTGAHFHGVLLPVFEDAEGAARFIRFMADSAPRFEARLTYFAQDHWEVSKDPKTFEWPDANWEA